jgi:hypothetical protein
VFIISGNHEHYQDVYGISPRIGDSLPGGGSKGYKRANAGVPADHNLTIYEACLMYGPDFGWYSKTTNFSKPFADWFYHEFTPLTDYRVTFKKQTLVALGWGDDEDLFTNVSVSQFAPDTSLYRAGESVSDIQLELVKAGKQHGTQRLILSHFPFASYDNKWGLTHNAKMDCTDNYLAKSYDDFSQGSFKKNRVKMHEYLSNKDYHYTLSGHSHRAGLYEGDFHNDFATASYSITGHEIPAPQETPLTLPVKGKSNMIVCGCSGPVGIQNHYGSPDEKGLGNWGLDYPSGNHITLTPGSEQIKRIIPQDPTAKPRFAVALDYMDILGREHDKRGVFESIVSDATGATFTFTVNRDLPKVKFIEDMKIVAYSGNKGDVYPMTVEGAGGVTATLSEAHKREIKFKLNKDKELKTFLHITFNTALANTDGYKQYNFDSPWTYPIEIIDRKAEMKKMLEAGGRGELSDYQIEQQVKMVSGYVLKRHEKVGEIPNFYWYSKTFGYGFKFPNDDGEES